MSWHRQAICGPSSPHLSDDAADQATAVGICQRCPVRHPCAEEALRNREPTGVWGGLTEAERRYIRTPGAHQIGGVRSTVCVGCGGELPEGQRRHCSDECKVAVRRLFDRRRKVISAWRTWYRDTVA